MKVYCKYCKWLRISRHLFANTIMGIECFAQAKWKPSAISAREELGGILDPFEQNQQNDCEFYKRKWWKFFVKG